MFIDLRLVHDSYSLAPYDDQDDDQDDDQHRYHQATNSGRTLGRTEFYVCIAVLAILFVSASYMLFICINRYCRGDTWRCCSCKSGADDLQQMDGVLIVNTPTNVRPLPTAQKTLDNSRSVTRDDISTPQPQRGIIVNHNNTATANETSASNSTSTSTSTSSRRRRKSPLGSPPSGTSLQQNSLQVEGATPFRPQPITMLTSSINQLPKQSRIKSPRSGFSPPPGEGGAGRKSPPQPRHNDQQLGAQQVASSHNKRDNLANVAPQSEITAETIRKHAKDWPEKEFTMFKSPNFYD